jgi:hypothetical protein
VLLHRGLREEGDDPQILGPGVVEVVRGPFIEDEDVARLDPDRLVVEQQLTFPGEDELRLLGGVDVLAESVPGRDREVDRRRLLGVLAAVGEEAADPDDLVAGCRTAVRSSRDRRRSSRPSLSPFGSRL